MMLLFVIDVDDADAAAADDDDDDDTHTKEWLYLMDNIANVSWTDKVVLNKLEVFVSAKIKENGYKVQKQIYATLTPP